MRKILAASVLVLVSGTPRAQVPGGAAVPAGIRFHHVHLNSVNPAMAAAYYPKAFTTSVQTTFNGYEAVRTINGPYLLFTQGEHASADPAAERDLAFRLEYAGLACLPRAVSRAQARGGADVRGSGRRGRGDLE